MVARRSRTPNLPFLGTLQPSARAQLLPCHVNNTGQWPPPLTGAGRVLLTSEKRTREALRDTPAYWN